MAKAMNTYLLNFLCEQMRSESVGPAAAILADLEDCAVIPTRIWSLAEDANYTLRRKVWVSSGVGRTYFIV